MNSFRNRRLSKTALPQSTVWLLADISEFKGKQELYTRQSPQLLQALRQMRKANRVECLGRGPGAAWKNVEG
jgi:hypothetical protein